MNNLMSFKSYKWSLCEKIKLLATLVLMAIALPACAAYSQQPSGYFSDPTQLALDQGADPNVVGKDGMTPLFWSVTMTANLEAFRYMLAHGGDPNLVIVDESKPGVSTIYLLYQAY